MSEHRGSDITYRSKYTRRQRSNDGMGEKKNQQFFAYPKWFSENSFDCFSGWSWRNILMITQASWYNCKFRSWYFVTFHVSKIKLITFLAIHLYRPNISRVILSPIAIYFQLSVFLFNANADAFIFFLI